MGIFRHRKEINRYYTYSWFFGLGAVDGEKIIGMVLGNIQRYCKQNHFYLQEMCIIYESRKKGINMFKKVALFIFAVLVLDSNSKSYISLTTQGINYGVIENRFDYGFGLNFQAQYNNFHSEMILNTMSGSDTIYTNDDKTIQFSAGPVISVGYYFSDSKFKPFIQVYSEALFPIYSNYEMNNNNGYFKTINIVGGLIGGIEYFIDDKISIGSGIGPYISYNKYENSLNNGTMSTSKSAYLWIASNFHFRYYF